MSLGRKLFGKYKSLPVPVKASIWFTICSFLQKGISMITMPIFTRLLPPEQYGVYTVYQSWYNIISIFATMNLSAGVFYNAMIKYEDDRYRFTSSMQGLSTVITLGLFTIYLCFSNYFNKLFDLPTILVMVLFIELVFVSPYRLWSAKQRFDFKYKNLVVVTLILTIMSPLIGIVAVLLSEHKAEARVFSYAGVQIGIGLVIFIYNHFKGKSFFVKKYWKYALWFNVPLIPHYLSMSILGQSDRIMINNMVGTSEAAIYGVAYNISQIMTLVTTSISNSFNPYTYKAIKDKKYYSIGKNAKILLVFVGVSVVLISCFGPEVIMIFAPEEYFDARWIIPPVSLSVYFIFLYPLFSNIEFYFEQNKFVTLASITGALLNILLNYIFIPIFGFIAAGFTTVVCYFFFAAGHCIFHRIVLKKYLPGVKIYDLRFIALFSIIITIATFGIMFLYDLMIVRYILISIIMIVAIIKRRQIIGIWKEIRKK